MKPDVASAGEPHPVSTFALDVYWTAGATADDAIAAHVAGCARCREYLALLGELEKAPVHAAPLSAPVAPPSLSAPRAGRFRVAGPISVAFAFAAGIALFVGGAFKSPPPVYVGVKGTPSVQLLVHRGSTTAIWDGRTAVHAGDAIALRAACSDLANVAVVAEDSAHGGWVRLSDTPCAKDEDVLPFTLVVDGASREERIAVVMSDSRLSDSALSRAAQDSERSSHAWAIRFVIPEERP